MREYEYRSPLAPYIEGLISQKRSMGFIYDSNAYGLKRFDDRCVENRIDDAVITKDMADDWAELTSKCSKSIKTRAISDLRQLSLYMNSLGIPSYIPVRFTEKDKHVPHLFTDEEIRAFFTAVDSYRSGSDSPAFNRMAIEYRILFRLIYCCGLRNNEACSLKLDDIDTEKGALQIIHSKGDKDRIVYLAEDMRILMEQYIQVLDSLAGPENEWLFPGRRIEKHVTKTSIDKVFGHFWEKTSFAETCDRKPTVHSLRHAFIEKRMSLWMEQGISLEQMIPYLSAYVGHRTHDDTFYYYHLTENAFSIIRKKDVTSSSVIPEVSHE